ncbi:hypothetical protein, partial [Primorskyibacter sp. 2E233]|uniref:hypothetical protein n=1 Tax=Primorskyibacter sp. 2E233 TaxID=3413431 RepID=UPI003BF35D2A
MNGAAGLGYGRVTKSFRADIAILAEQLWQAKLIMQMTARRRNKSTYIRSGRESVDSAKRQFELICTAIA